MNKAVALNEGIEEAEAFMLNHPQVDCPVVHHFGPNIYVREVTLPAGIFSLGHRQKHDHLNIMLTGKVAMYKDGEIVILEAPMIFVGKPGRKFGYVLETCVWQNIYSTSETDIDKLEDMFLDKSPTWQEYDKSVNEFEYLVHETDRDDFKDMLSESGYSAETVREQSENLDDQIDMPEDWASIVSVRDSNIEGKGLFLSYPVKKGAIIAPARINGMRTPAGRFVNHSKTPNCFYTKTEGGDVYLVAMRDIHGCMGGSKGEELTVNYRQALSLSNGDKLCQE